MGAKQTRKNAVRTNEQADAMDTLNDALHKLESLPDDLRSLSDCYGLETTAFIAEHSFPNCEATGVFFVSDFQPLQLLENVGVQAILEAEDAEEIYLFLKSLDGLLKQACDKLERMPPVKVLSYRIQ